MIAFTHYIVNNQNPKFLIAYRSSPSALVPFECREFVLFPLSCRIILPLFGNQYRFIIRYAIRLINLHSRRFGINHSSVQCLMLCLLWVLCAIELFSSQPTLLQFFCPLLTCPASSQSRIVVYSFIIDQYMSMKVC